MILRGKNVFVEKIGYEKVNLKGLYYLDDFISLDDIFIEKSIEEMNKKVPRVYSYYIKNNESQILGIISFEVISMMNEYIMSRIHFISDDLSALIEGLDLILEWQILKNNMLKIIANEGESQANEVLIHEHFIKETFKDGSKGFKLTKPIYLEKRGASNE